jgi:hypothetical protein
VYSGIASTRKIKISVRRIFNPVGNYPTNLGEADFSRIAATARMVTDVAQSGSSAAPGSYLHPFPSILPAKRRGWP